MMDSRPAAEVDREDLLHRVLTLRPACTLLVAPSGYGKSWFARKLAARAAGSIFCDLSDVHALDELYRALQIERPVLESWEAAVASACARSAIELIVFENAHAIALQQPLVDRVIRLAQVGSLRVVICSQTTLFSAWLRRFAPHDLFRIGMRDLEFRREDVRAILTEAGAPPTVIAEATLAARGNPAAVMAVAGALAAGSPNPLEPLRAIPDADTLPPAADEAHGRALLSAIARMGFAGAEDLEALGTSVSAIVAMTGGSPFFTFEDGGIRAHDRAREAFATDANAFTLLRAAAAKLIATNPLRAAELFLLVDAGHDAVRLVARSLRRYVPQTPSLQVSRLIVGAGSDAIRREPIVWAALAQIREASEPLTVLLDDAREMFRLASDAGALERAVAAAFALVPYLLDAGETIEALEVMDDLGRLLKGSDDTPDVRRAADLLVAVIHARTGEGIALPNVLAAIAPLLDSQPHLRAFFFLEAAALGAVGAMDRSAARTFFDQAIEAARAEPISRHARALILSAFFAWCAGELDLFARQLRDLQDLAVRAVISDASNFVACCRGETSGRTFFSPLLEACAFVIAAATASAGPAKKTAARRALDAAVHCGWAPVIAFAVAAFDRVFSDRSAATYCRAAEATAQFANPQWRAALEQLEAAGDGMLSVFAARFGESAPRRYTLSITSRRLTCGGKTIALTSRDFSILGVLAVTGKPVSALHLCRLLFPDDDRENGVKVLRVSISRLRSKAGDAELVASTKSGYRIGSDVVLDVTEAERIARDCESGRAVTDADLAVLQSLVAVPPSVQACVAQEPWAESWVRRVDLVRHRGMFALAKAAARRGDDYTVVRIMRDALAEDPTDEAAVDELIAALQRRGEGDEISRVRTRFASACRHEVDRR